MLLLNKLSIFFCLILVGPGLGALCDNARNNITGDTSICGDLLVDGVIGGVVQSINVDNGGDVVPLVNTLQVSGVSGSGFVPSGIETHNGGGTGDDVFIENRRWVSQYVVDASTTVGARGTFTTIQSAINAAALSGSPVQIYIRPGTYTENLTLRAGVNLEGITVDGRIGSINIEGNHTFADSGAGQGICALENINFSTATGDSFTVNPSSGNCLLVFKFCSVNNSLGVAYVLAPSPGASVILGQENSQTFAGTQCITLSESSVASLTGCSLGNSVAGQTLVTIDGNSICLSTVSSFTSTGNVFDLLSSNANVSSFNSTYQCTGLFLQFTAPGTVVTGNDIIVATDPSGFYVAGAGTLRYANHILVGSAKKIDSTTTQDPQTWRPFASSGDYFTAVRGTAGFDLNEFTAYDGFIQLATPPNFFASYTNVTTSPYVATDTDQYISVDTSSSPITIQLPDMPAAYRTFTIKDRLGNASVNNITVTTVGGVVTIDGSATQAISANYGALQVVFNGSSYEIYALK